MKILHFVFIPPNERGESMATFTLRLDNGFFLHGLRVIENEKNRYLVIPKASFRKKGGELVHYPAITFDPEVWPKFRADVFKLIDACLEEEF